MRLVRLGITAASALAAVIVLPAGTAHANPTYTAFTVDGTTSDSAFTRDDVYEGAGVTVSVGSSNQSINFIGTLEDGSHTGSQDLTLVAHNGESLVAGTFTVTATDTAGTLGASLFSGTGGSCTSPSGSVDITEFGTDSGTGAINVFAASYTLDCSSGATLSGELRWNSTQGYDAVAVAPRTWDFGTQLAGRSGIAKTFTFANHGANPVTYTAATLAGSSTWFAITGDTCSNQVIAAGASCTVTVTPRPRSVSSGVPTTATLELPTATPAVPTRLVPLSEIGSSSPDVLAMAGPQRVGVSWGLLPAVQNAQVTGFNIYRGTSPTNIAYLRHVGPGTFASNDYTVTAGHAYYYQVKPTIQDGAGDLTPVVAAQPWPKYQAGMYHRLSRPVRFLSAHRVTAGHPYTLYVDGHHGVPGSHVAAVAVDITAARPSAGTSVTAYPYGTSRPAQPDVMVRAGATRSNFAIVKVGTGGRIRIATSHGSTPITVDISGYYSAAGLSTSYGTGGAGHTLYQPVTVLNTKADGVGALPSGYYIDVPVIFDPSRAPHVTSLAVEITAYGGRGGGTLTAFPTNGSAPNTSALAYSAGTVSSNVAIVSAGRFNYQGVDQPSIAILNRGSRGVQLVVTVVGYYDDNSLLFGERYVPTSPLHLGLSNPLHTNSLRTLYAGYTHANVWTTALNLHLSALAPTATTAIKVWPKSSSIGAPPYGQLRAPAHVNTLSSAVVPLGPYNRMYLRNTSGTTTVNVWSFGRFDAYPQPAARNYASAGSVSVAVLPQRAPATRAARAY